jgi:hypothetical protein
MIYHYSSKLKMGQLKARRRERGLKVGGKKGELVSRLENEDRRLQVSRYIISTLI